MPFQLNWQDNASNETKQNVYVCDGFNSNPQVLKTVAANVTATDIELTAGHPSPAFLTVTAATESAESAMLSYYIAANITKEPAQFRRLSSQMYANRRALVADNIEPAGVDFDATAFGACREFHVLGNGDIVGITALNDTVDSLVVFDQNTFVIKLTSSFDAIIGNAVVGKDGRLYFLTKNGNAMEGFHAQINSFDGKLIIPLILDGRMDDFLGNGTYLSDTGNIRFFSSNGDVSWFMEYDPTELTLSTIDVRMPVYGSNLTTSLDGYNERMAYQADKYLVFVRSQVQNGSTLSTIVTRVNQTTGVQQQQVSNGQFVNLDGSNLVVSGDRLFFHCPRSRAMITMSWDTNVVIVVANNGVGTSGSLVEMPNGEVMMPVQSAEGITFNHYNQDGEVPDGRNVLAYAGLTLGGYGVFRTRSGVMFYDYTNKVSCLVKQVYNEVKIDPMLVGVDFNAGSSGRRNDKIGTIHRN